MFDTTVRAALEAPLDRVAGWLDRPGISPDRLTLAGLGVGLASAGAAAGRWWAVALVCWLLCRVLDGLDGPLARRRARASATDAADVAGKAIGSPSGSPAGGFFDITADFTVYGATVVGVAIGVAGSAESTGAVGEWLPFLAVLLAYYVNGAAFLAFSSIAERTGHRIDDGRSLSFLGGLAEGTETVVVHSVWLILPFWAPQIATVWAVVVGVSAGHRVIAGYRTLRLPPG